jgi:hypothetical protein
MSQNLNLGIGFSTRDAKDLTAAIKAQSQLFNKLLPVMENIHKESSGVRDDIAVTNLGFGKLWGGLRILRKPIDWMVNKFGQMVEHSHDLQKRFTHLSALFGSSQMGGRLLRFSRSMQTTFGISADSIDQINDSLSELGLSADKINIKGLIGGGTLTGDIGSTLSALDQLARGGSIADFQKTFKNTMSYSQIARAMQGALTMQDKLISGANLLASVYGQNVNRELQNTYTSMGRMAGVWDSFKDSIVDPSVKGGIMDEVRKVMKDIADYLVGNKDKIMKLGRSISQVLGGAFKSLVNMVKPVAKIFKGWISDSDGAIEKFQQMANKAVLAIYLVGKKLAWAFQHPKEAIKQFANFMFETIIGGVVDLGKELWGKMPTGAKMATGAIIGGKIGAIFGPIGAVIGAAFGAPFGLIDDWDQFFDRISGRIDKIVASGKVLLGTMTMNKSLILEGMTQFAAADEKVEYANTLEALRKMSQSKESMFGILNDKFGDKGLAQNRASRYLSGDKSDIRVQGMERDFGAKFTREWAESLAGKGGQSYGTNKLTSDVFQAAQMLSEKTGVDAKKLLALWSIESGLKSDAQTASGTYTGLWQGNGSDLKKMGIGDGRQLKELSPMEQAKLQYEYMKKTGLSTDIVSLYAKNLSGAYDGKSNTIYAKGGTRFDGREDEFYTANQWLDNDKNGQIDRGDLQRELDKRARMLSSQVNDQVQLKQSITILIDGKSIPGIIQDNTIVRQNRAGMIIADKPSVPRPTTSIKTVAKK